MLVIVRKLIGVLSILAGFGVLALLLLMMSTNRSVSALLLPGLFLIGGLWLFGGILTDVGDRPGKTDHPRPPTSAPSGWRPPGPAPSWTGPYGPSGPRPQPVSGAGARSARPQTNGYHPQRHLHSVQARWQPACTAHDAVTTALVVYPPPPKIVAGLAAKADPL